MLYGTFRALRGRAGARALLSAPTLPAPPRCPIARMQQYRCLSKVAVVPGNTMASETAAGQKQDTAGAGSASTEVDEMADPRHILLYEGSKVGDSQTASLSSLGLGLNLYTHLASPRNRRRPSAITAAARSLAARKAAHSVVRSRIALWGKVSGAFCHAQYPCT